MKDGPLRDLKPRAVGVERPYGRTSGFRVSFTDSLAIGAFGFMSLACWRIGSPLWWLILIAAGHFFLFCNVFRVSRRRELIWAAVFILHASAWAWSGKLNWLLVLACQTPVSFSLIWRQIKSPDYHGILASRWNPHLAAYLKG